MDKTDLLGIMAEVINERSRQDAKFGTQDHRPIEWIAILVEEVGEVAQAALHLHFPNHLGKTSAEYREEMIQVAAVAIAAIECLDRAPRGQP